MNKFPVFPTFKEIEEGYQVYERTGRYLGLNEYGDPRFAKMNNLEIVLAHNRYYHLFKLYIVRDKKLKERTLFKIVFPSGAYITELYSAAGYERLKESLYLELDYILIRIHEIAYGVYPLPSHVKYLKSYRSINKKEQFDNATQHS